jgi:hypothetical protein
MKTQPKILNLEAHPSIRGRQGLAAFPVVDCKTTITTNELPVPFPPQHITYPYSHPPPIPYYPYPPPPPYYTDASMASGHHSSSPNILPSSEQDTYEDPTLFPKVDEWLTALDKSVLAVDGHEFSKHAAYLTSQGYTCLSQIAEMSSPRELVQLCPDLVEGTARMILKQACKEVDKIRKRETKLHYNNKKQHY